MNRNMQARFLSKAADIPGTRENTNWRIESTARHAPVHITVVQSPAQLIRALQDGREHIEVQQHLDMTSLSTANYTFWTGLEVLSPTLSLRVRFFETSFVAFTPAPTF